MTHGIFITVVGPPILAEGTATVLRSAPFVGRVTVLSDPGLAAADLMSLPAQVVVVHNASLLPSVRERADSPILWLVIADGFNAVPEDVPVAVHVSEDAAIVRAGLLAAVSDRRYRSPRLRPQSPTPVRPALPVLTQREREALVAAAQGASNREIAVRLGISAESVKTYLRAGFKKLGIHRRAQIAPRLAA
jgi:DNA-binding CsgD family transcriptional regulator